MSCETSKCRAWRRAQGHFARYLHGHGIDIGAGSDPLAVDDGWVYPWDLGDGDAQLMAGVPDASFDFVYSSHTLEHMRDVPEALKNWRRICKPGGWLYIVVPDYQFYEKLCWPSRFNPDHKHSFSRVWPSREAVGRENHWTWRELLPLLGDDALDGLQLDGFDFNRPMVDQTAESALSQIYYVARNR